MGTRLVLALLAGSILSGCFGQPKDEDQDGTTTTAPTGPITNETGGNGTANETTTSPGEGPHAEFEVEGENLTRENDTYAGFTGTLNFSANASGPDIESYEWDFGDGANGTGVETNHTYTSAGNFTVFLNVTDSEGRTAQANATLQLQNKTGGAGEPFITDPEDDADSNQGDILTVFMSNNETHLLINITFGGTQTLAGTHSLWMPSLFLNDNRYEPWFCAGDGGEVFSYEDNENIDGSSAEVDSDTDTWVLTIPLEGISTEPPFAVYVESRVGDPCALGGAFDEDRAPDEGTKTYEPS